MVIHITIGSLFFRQAVLTLVDESPMMSVEHTYNFPSNQKSLANQGIFGLLQYTIGIKRYDDSATVSKRKRRCP